MDLRSGGFTPGTAVVADDALVVRTVISDVLQDLGFKVVGQAANGLQAVMLCHQHRPALLTLDLSMPELGGLDALQQITAEGSVGAVLVVSVLSGEQTVAKVMAAGGAAVLGKPFKREQLAKVVRDLGLAAG